MTPVAVSVAATVASLVLLLAVLELVRRRRLREKYALLWILTAIVHIGFALAVLNDSQMLWTHLRRKTFFVGRGLWALATLLGGVFVAAIYWSIHHSTLRPQQPTSASRVEPESPATPK